MNKKVYKLNDIEKLLTFIPPFFIFILAILATILSYFIIDYQEKSQIKLLKQEEHFISQNYLNTYVNIVDKKIKKHLEDVQKELKKRVYTLSGIYKGIYLKKDNSPTQRLMYYIKEIESNSDISFVIFDKNLHILYGSSIIKNIEELIFNTKDNKKLLQITLLYIQSQGKNSSFSWKNDLSKTIQLSYFQNSDDSQIYIGAFSSIDSLKTLTSNAFLNSIRDSSYAPKDFYFWLFDKAEKKAYNLKNQKKWQITHKIKTPSTEFDFAKYFLTVGINKHTDTTLIEEIQKTYKNKLILIFAIIFFIAMIFITATTIFSTFIKRIFTSFNRRFENKTKQIVRLKERYELAVIASNDGLWDTNFKTNKTFFSKKWLNMLGYNIGDISSYQEWFELLHVNDKSKIKKILKEYANQQKKDHIICEYRIKMKNGEYKWILARGKMFFDERGEARRLLMMSMDIDDKKEADKKLHRLVKEEVGKNQEKEKLLIQQNKLAAMGEMIGSIAHQWRQPLNNISLILHFIRDNVQNKNFIESMLNEYVNRAKKQITYMSDTIDDFRNFYKPSKNKEIFDVKEAIKSTLTIIQAQLDIHNVEVSLSQNGLKVNGHENEFKQAILNILSNAKDAIELKKRKKNDFKGKIIITIKKDISIFNNGGNANEQVLERMFEPYFTTKFENKGTGIGLYMTKTIIENSMNGQIYAKNRDDGVVFGIIFSKGDKND